MSRADGSQSPSLQGEHVVFTGRLNSVGRREARALVEALGGTTSDDVTQKTTLLVVGDEGYATGAATSTKLARAAAWREDGTANIVVIPEEEFCRRVGRVAPATLRQRYSSLRDVLQRYPGLREDHVRYLIKYGVIRPVARTHADLFFGVAEVAVIRQVHEAAQQGRPFRDILRHLLAVQQGQLQLDFRLDAAPARIVTLTPRTTPVPPTPTARDRAEAYFLEASALDDGEAGTRDEAARLYRAALAADPALVPALINLANLHYAVDEPDEAAALYARAIALEPDFFEAHFNLGNIHHDRGVFEEARRCYLDALALHPTYADAHFYLAVTLEKMGRSPEAVPHWRAYVRQAPQGEWVALAREFAGA